MLSPTMLQTSIHSTILRAYDDRYQDRLTAGRLLADQLRPHHPDRALVLAIPSGGIAVGGELARSLRLGLEVIVSREFYVPGSPPIVAGAVCEGGGLCFNAAALRLPGVTMEAIWYQARLMWREIVTLVAAYRGDRALPLLPRRTVILTDDGIGSGLAQLAAIQVLRREHVHQCIVATPGGSAVPIHVVTHWADTLVSLDLGEHNPHAPNSWNVPIGDDEAASMLCRCRQRLAERGTGACFDE